MGTVSTVNSTSLGTLLEKVKQRTAACNALEEAAQIVTDVVYDEFRDSFVMVRMYATVPFGKLPETNRFFVSDLSQLNQITSLIKDDTLVLSLLGTRGVEPDWNDRRKSQGHVGIPLASADFVDKIPMISRLLKEVGLNLDWIDSHDTAIAVKNMRGISGIFHVLDARQAVDNLGRKIIPAQSFVEENHIRTVFGLGSVYSIGSMFITLIVFCRETLDKPRVELFSPLIEVFKTNTTSLASAGTIFA